MYMDVVEQKFTLHLKVESDPIILLFLVSYENTTDSGGYCVLFTLYFIETLNT